MNAWKPATVKAFAFGWICDTDWYRLIRPSNHQKTNVWDHHLGWALWYSNLGTTPFPGYEMSYIVRYSHSIALNGIAVNPKKKVPFNPLSPMKPIEIPSKKVGNPICSLASLTRTSGKDDVSFSISNRPFARNVELGSTTRSVYHRMFLSSHGDILSGKFTWLWKMAHSWVDLPISSGDFQ